MGKIKISLTTFLQGKEEIFLSLFFLFLPESVVAVAIWKR